MLRRFFLEEPESVEEASRLLARYGDEARLYAGGTELLLAMKESLIRCERLVNIKRISGLARIHVEDGWIHVGALATHHILEESAILNEILPWFAEMERRVANVRVREVGTIGGNLCFAEPHSDPAPLLLVSGAKLRARSAASEREIPIEDFFPGPFETALAADEILTEIRLPVPPPRAAAAYLKFGQLERPSVGVAAFVWLENGARVAECRIAVGSAGPVPKRVSEAEALLAGEPFDPDSAAVGEAAAIAGRAAEAVSDIHGPADYKEHLVGVLLRRALGRAYRAAAAASS